LQSLLEIGPLLDTDIDETLSGLPSTLNETYDSILLRIRPAHRDLTAIALRWIAVAQQPLMIAELIEACMVNLEAGGRVRKDQRLSPAEIVLLLRHLVVLEKDYTTSTVACGTDFLVFAHFSVQEYLTTPTYMAPAIRPSFAVNMKQAHLYVASSCVAYLLRTNAVENRETVFFPLLKYAWGFWALHAVTPKADTTIEKKCHWERADELREQVDSGSDDDCGIPEDLQRIIWWADSKSAVLHCLRESGHFFDAYACDVDIYDYRQGWW